MADKKSDSFLSADVDFHTNIREAFKKPMRQNVQPVVVGSVIEMEPAYDSKATQTLYGLILAADPLTQELQVAPIEECHVCSSKGNEFNCFVSHHDILAAMGKEKPITINVSGTHTRKLAQNQITDNDNYMFLTQDQDYPLIRAIGKAPDNVMAEAKEIFGEYLYTLQRKQEEKPHMADGVVHRAIPSPTAKMMEWGAPEPDLH